jgi:quercetin dioxygenase-like cupin family protein
MGKLRGNKMSSHKRNDNALEKANVFKLAELVSYLPASIISRVLHRNEVGNITLFAFAAGEELSAHSAPFDAYVQILDGEAVVTIDQTKHDLVAGQVIIMPANIPHAVYAKSNFKMLLVMIRG